MNAVRRPEGHADLIVFSDDWGRHPSSCQHLVAELLDDSNRDLSVLWVNTIGTRPLRLDRYTFKRAGEKLAHWISPSSSTQPPAQNFPASNSPAQEQVSSPAPRVTSPIMWPSFASRGARRMNQALLLRHLSKFIDSNAPPVIVTTLPIVADLAGVLSARRWVYYCVDDLAAWPGLDARPLREMELDLIRRVDRIVVVSETLKAHIESHGKTASLLTHGVALEHWRAGAKTSSLPQELDQLERPWVVFWGVIDRRLNTEWLRQLNDTLGRGTIVLAGPENQPDPAIESLERVKKVGPLPYEALPSLADQMSVAIMPYSDLPVTRAIQPLKLKEYLATGKPVVVSLLPSTQEWQSSCDVTSDARSFANAVRERILEGVPSQQRCHRNHALETESWGAKSQLFRSILFDDPPQDHPPQTMTANP